VAAYLSGSIGPKRAVTVCLFSIGLFGLVRAASAGTATLLLTTVGIGIPVGIAGALLPVAVKHWFMRRPVGATSIYASGIQLGATGSAMAAVPFAHAAGGWRGTLVIFSLIGLAFGVSWMLLTRGDSARATPHAPPPRLPFGNPVAWLLAVVFFLQAVPYHALNAWLPAYLRESGWPETTAGTFLGLMNLMALTGTLLVPVVADRWGSRRSYILIGAMLATIGVVGLILQVSAAPVWTATVGFGLGVMFPLVLTLPLDVSHTPAEAGAVAGIMLGLGYSLSALAPTGLGFIRDATGSFSLSLWVIVGCCGILLLCMFVLSPRRLSRTTPQPDYIPPAGP
jgi:MFS transporter, CP family, cyanate transporter